MLIDTHCHIDLYDNPENILAYCVDKNLTVISMTNLPSHFNQAFPFFEPLKRIRLALGMHPLLAQFHPEEIETFAKLLPKTSYVGEIGLDFSREGINTKDIQLQTFRKILGMVAGQKKLLSLHSRSAEEEVFSLLLKYRVELAIFHWYSGKLNLIDKIAGAGYYFSINPAMVKSINGKKIISKIPREYVLTETDGPFVMENNRSVQPGQVNSVINYLSSEWLMTAGQVSDLIQTNFRRLIAQLHK